ncbi:hypothetical protein PoB_005388500 [Plakobranchus ocellatus]|uniref:Uncharacterized protein n=1 Tax=Plakobranchus ocellatus TaxID=259542 RepID=A0AAV4C6Q6_9GAST|nr:hypothetical protein PoB_005388500 [Plakobranchus ocellatus]
MVTSSLKEIRSSVSEVLHIPLAGNSTMSCQCARLLRLVGTWGGVRGFFCLSNDEFYSSAPGLSAHHGAQPRELIAQTSTSVLQLSCSYTPAEGLGPPLG